MIHSVSGQNALQRMHHISASQKVAMDVSDHPHVNQDEVVESDALNFLAAWVSEPDTLLSPEEMASPKVDVSQVTLEGTAKATFVEPLNAPVTLTSFDPLSTFGFDGKS